MTYRIANAPCSWGVIEGIDGSRDQYKQVLDEMEATGYAGTELGDWGFMPTDSAQLAKVLADHHLSLLASWMKPGCERCSITTSAPGLRRPPKQSACST